MNDDEIGVKYMQAWEEIYYDKQEAREDGLAEGLTAVRNERRIIRKPDISTERFHTQNATVLFHF